jgi:hypothetical protein
METFFSALYKFLTEVPVIQQTQVHQPPRMTQNKVPPVESKPVEKQVLPNDEMELSFLRSLSNIVAGVNIQRSLHGVVIDFLEKTRSGEEKWYRIELLAGKWNWIGLITLPKGESGADTK